MTAVTVDNRLDRIFARLEPHVGKLAWAAICALFAYSLWTTRQVWTGHLQYEAQVNAEQQRLLDELKVKAISYELQLEQAGKEREAAAAHRYEEQRQFAEVQKGHDVLLQQLEKRIDRNEAKLEASDPVRKQNRR